MQSVCGQQSADLIGPQLLTDVGVTREPDRRLDHQRVPDGTSQSNRADGGLVPHLRAR